MPCKWHARESSERRPAPDSPTCAKQQKGSLRSPCTLHAEQSNVAISLKTDAKTSRLTPALLLQARAAAANLHATRIRLAA
eukprot:6196860-Pleurochrysis_carterae.AAC.4